MAIALLPPKIGKVSTHENLPPAAGHEGSLAQTGQVYDKNVLLKNYQMIAKAGLGRSADLKNRETEGPLVRKLKPAQSVLRWFLQGRCDVEELLLQLYFGNLSVASVDSIIERLWGEKRGVVFLTGIIPDLVGRLDQCLKRPIPESYPYISLHAAEIPRRRSSREKEAWVAAVAGIAGNGIREILSVQAAPAEAGDFWDTLLGNLSKRGLVPPRFVIMDTTITMRTAVARCWPSSKCLPFESSLDRELLRGVSFADRDLGWSLMARFRSACGADQARRLAEEVVNRLNSSGYPNLSMEMKSILEDHCGYFEISPVHRIELRKFEFIRTELGRLRERVRIIGPGLEPEVLARFAAAGLRRACARSGDAKPVSSFG